MSLRLKLSSARASQDTSQDTLLPNTLPKTSAAFPGQKLTGGIVVADGEGNIFEWSAEALRMHGYDSVDEVRKHISEFTKKFAFTRPGGGNVPFEEWPLPKLIRGETVDNYELRLHRLDTGQSWFINYSGVRVAMPGTDKQLLIVTLQDVTEWHRAHAALVSSEEAFHQLADAMPQIVWTARPDGEIDYFNRHWYELTGRKPGTAGHRDWLNVRHPDDMDAVRERWAHAVEAGTPFESEYRLYNRLDGTYRWHLGRALPALGANGEVRRWFGSSTDIDDVKRAANALRDSELRLRGVVDTAADGIATLDDAGFIETANPALARMLGRPLSDILRKPLTHFIPQLSSDQLSTWSAGPGSQDHEAIGRRSDGEPFPIDISISRLSLSGQNHFTAIIRDTTGRKESERLLRDRHTLLRTLVEGVTDPLYVKSADGRFLYLNAATAQLADRPTDDCVNKTTTDLFGPEIGQKTQEMERRVLTSTQPVTYEETVVLGGEEKHFLITKLAFRDEDGVAAGLVGFSRDITMRKRAEDVLEYSERHLRDVLNSLPAAVVVVSVGGVISDMNAIAEEIVARHGEVVRPTAWGELPWLSTSPQQRDAFENALARAAAGQAAQLSNVMIASAEPIAFDVTLAPMRDDSGAITHVLVTAINVTERRVAETVAREQQAGLAHLERVQTMGHMASGLAHELNQPLGAIVNFAGAGRQTLSRGTVAQVELDALLEDIQSEASRAGEIIRRLRNFVNKQQPQVQAIAPETLLNDAMRILSYELRHNHIAVSVDCRDGLPNVLADAVQVTQVIVNLVRNALDAMLGLEPGERRLTIAAERDPVGVKVSVTDVGGGVAAADIGRLFDAFYTTKSHGLGMGLALCRMIIEDHGGHITARQNTSKGMQFAFTLRAASANGVGDGIRAKGIRR